MRRATLILVLGLLSSGLYAAGSDDFVPQPAADLSPVAPTDPVQAPPAPVQTPPPPAQTYGGASGSGLGLSRGSGKIRLSGTLGWGRAYDQDYTILGIGAGYYWWRGFETGADFEGWFGNTPKIYKISPEARYLMREFPGPLKPYVGGFYRHTFNEDFPDLDSVGGRVGAVLASRAGASIGAGAVYEHYMNCNESVFGECDIWYPEVTFLFSF